jgi:hypothetical protein
VSISGAALDRFGLIWICFTGLASLRLLQVTEQVQDLLDHPPQLARYRFHGAARVSAPRPPAGA